MDLKNVSTKELVEEIARREGVANIIVNVEDSYLISIDNKYGFTVGETGDYGPAIIFIVVD